MFRGNVLSGAPFRVTLLCLLVFSAILLTIAVSIYQLMSSSMYAELEDQIREETILLHEIYDSDGQGALIAVLSQLEQPVIAEQRIAGLFDSRGNRLAGNIPTAPGFVGWQTTTMNLIAPVGRDRFHLITTQLEKSTLVVGRSTRSIETVLQRLIKYFTIAGLLGALTSLLIGYLVSRRMFLKLKRLADILDAVSRGDMKVRLPVDASNDQIDRVSRQINAHLDQLAALMSSTRNTVNSIAHDLRAPLNRTHLILQDAIAAEGTESKTGALIDDAGAELSKVNEIIDTILRIARIQGGSDHIYLTNFPLSEQVADLADIFQPVIENAGQMLVRKIGEPGDTTVYGDKKMLRQMLVNLIENAICHCPAGTEITLEAGGSAQEGAFICVSDNGFGLLPELREKVLEPFFRVDASRSTPGSGLGLTLVHAIAVRHSATLSLEDNQPGLRVRVAFLPVQQGEADDA